LRRRRQEAYGEATGDRLRGFRLRARPRRLLPTRRQPGRGIRCGTAGILFRRGYPLHTAAAPAGAVHAAAHIVSAALMRVGRVWRLSLPWSQLGTSTERQHDQKHHESTHCPRPMAQAYRGCGFGPKGRALSPQRAEKPAPYFSKTKASDENAAQMTHHRPSDNSAMTMNAMPTGNPGSVSRRARSGCHIPSRLRG
jgi:hypothetical protein